LGFSIFFHCSSVMYGAASNDDVNVGVQQVRDVDDGLERSVYVRPRGSQDWCSLSADFS
jgi:hypothetical protein